MAGRTVLTIHSNKDGRQFADEVLELPAGVPLPPVRMTPYALTPGST
jgi:hypothetical protein